MKYKIDFRDNCIWQLEVSPMSVYEELGRVLKLLDSTVTNITTFAIITERHYKVKHLLFPRDKELINTLEHKFYEFNARHVTLTNLMLD